MEREREREREREEREGLFCRSAHCVASGPSLLSFVREILQPLFLPFRRSCSRMGAGCLLYTLLLLLSLSLSLSPSFSLSFSLSSRFPSRVRAVHQVVAVRTDATNVRSVLSASEKVVSIRRVRAPVARPVSREANHGARNSRKALRNEDGERGRPRGSPARGRAGRGRWRGDVARQRDNFRGGETDARLSRVRK